MLKKLSGGLFLFFLVGAWGCHQASSDPFIAVNLVGYNVDDPKQALLVNALSKEFEIVDDISGHIVYWGKGGDQSGPDISTGDSTTLIDFSDFKLNGNYILRLKKRPEIHSRQFSVGNDVYKKATLAAVQSYYYNRCATEVNNGELWKHRTCHLDDAVFYSDITRYRDVSGGWHDAGDYGKFSINTALSAALILYLYELRPNVFPDGQLNIPESANGIPDLLDEVRWALEWLMKMQDEKGGVYHKVSQKKWIGEFLPDEDPGKRYVFEISSNATAGFSAVAALGAQLFRPYDADFAEKLSKSAFKGWQYLETHEEMQPPGGFKNPQGVVGGEYGDNDDTDERLWAAVELYKLNNDEKFLDYFVKNYQKLNVQELPPLSWRDFHSLSLSTFVNTAIPEAFERARQNTMYSLTIHAQELLEKHKANSYHTLLNHNEYYWGSGSVNLGYAFVLIQLHRITGDENYYQSALDQLHYTMGRNPFDKSLVTGIGTSSVNHPYHQFSMELNANKPVPGMVVGGSNNHLHLRGKEISKYPGKNYVDDEKNYLVNEVAINWTAIFAFVSGYYISAEKKGRCKLSS